MQGLSELAGSASQTYLGFVSGDGSVIVGLSPTVSSGPRPFYWTETTGIQPLQTTIDSTEYGANVVSVSEDGSNVVGYLYTGSNGNQDYLKPAYWSNGQLQVLLPPDYPTTFYYPRTGAEARAVSPDGSTVLISLENLPVSKNYLWSQANGFTELISENNGNRVVLSEMSGNQQYFAGIQMIGGEYDQINQGLIWSEDSGLVLFDMLEGRESCAPMDMSFDGSVVVGMAWDLMQWLPSSRAFIWTSQDGIQLLSDVLANNYGLMDPLSGWTLTSATGISADGRTICGYGINPDGNQEGWVVTIPEPMSLLLLGVGCLFLRRNRDV